MIAHLEGVLAEAIPPSAVIDVHGVGYEVILPVSAFDKMPRTGGKVRVLTHFHVREDVQQLYGFLTRQDRDLFRLLLRVSGIGPRVAVGILGAVTPAAFKNAVVGGDARALARLPGVGKKKADRLIVELRDQIGVAAAWQTAAGAAAGGGDTRPGDATMALIALGYKPADAHRAVSAAAAAAGKDATVEELVRRALGTMGAAPS